MAIYIPLHITCPTFLLVSTINAFLFENIWYYRKNCNFRHFYMLRIYLNLRTFFNPENWLAGEKQLFPCLPSMNGAYPTPFLSWRQADTPQSYAFICVCMFGRGGGGCVKLLPHPFVTWPMLPTCKEGRIMLTEFIAYARCFPFNPTSHGVTDSVATKGGASEAPPWEIKEGVISDPKLLYSICYLVYLGVTCKKSARNIKIWARFQDFKILWIWNFTSPWQTKNWHNSLDFEDTGLKLYMQA